MLESGGTSDPQEKAQRSERLTVAECGAARKKRPEDIYLFGVTQGYRKEKEKKNFRPCNKLYGKKKPSRIFKNQETIG